MPLPANKEEQEDRVLALTQQALLRAGWSSSLIEQPDRLAPAARTYPDVTSDGLFRISRGSDAFDWAVDVMSLALPASHHIVPSGLHDRLGTILDEHQIVLRLEGESPEASDLASIQRGIGEAVSDSPGGGTWSNGDLEGAWRSVTTDEQPRLALLIVMPAPSALLSDQILDVIGPPLRKKAVVQAGRARAAGCRTAVVLDWPGHEGIAQGTQWLSRSPTTVAAAVAEALDGQESNLCSVWLVDRAHISHHMHGDLVPNLTTTTS